MNPGEIYAKTDEGVRELKERKLNLPIALRSVLIMVDGNRTVGEVLERAQALRVDSSSLAALERAAQGLKCDTVVHICYGYGIKANIDWKATLGSEWRQYQQTFPLLAQSSIRQVSLECANSRVPLELLGLLAGKDVLVGAIDVATDQVETPQEVAATLRAALAFVPANRLYACTNCGMVPLSRGLARAKLDALAAGAALVRNELSS